jgi:hypothetical protein
VSLGAGLVLTLRRQPPATLSRYGMADLMRSGRWLLAIEAITAGATFLASVIVTQLDDPAALGYAEAPASLASRSSCWRSDCPPCSILARWRLAQVATVRRHDTSRDPSPCCSRS